MNIISRLFLIVFLVTGSVRLTSAETAGRSSELLPAYVKISAALAVDDLATAQAAASALAEHAAMLNQSQIAEQSTAVSKADDLSTARNAFKLLSNSVEPLAIGANGYTVMACSMAKADWVQTTGAVKNPYLGKSMQTCGKPKTVDASPAHCPDNETQGCKGM